MYDPAPLTAPIVVQDIVVPSGTRLVTVMREDIDRSTTHVTVTRGSVRVRLSEAIWSNWVVRFDTTVLVGVQFSQMVDVADNWYDGDHHLEIFAEGEEPIRYSYSFDAWDL